MAPSNSDTDLPGQTIGNSTIADCTTPYRTTPSIEAYRAGIDSGGGYSHHSPHTERGVFELHGRTQRNTGNGIIYYRATY